MYSFQIPRMMMRGGSGGEKKNRGADSTGFALPPIPVSGVRGAAPGWTRAVGDAAIVVGVVQISPLRSGPRGESARLAGRRGERFLREDYERSRLGACPASGASAALCGVSRTRRGNAPHEIRVGGRGPRNAAWGPTQM